MMMSPESYYMGLEGKTAEEILTELNGLRREISELKAALRSNDFTVPDIKPSRGVRLSMALDYFDMAKKALIEAGGEYTPTEDERRALGFNTRLDGLTALEFTVSRHFLITKTLSADFSGGKTSAKIICETNPLYGNEMRKKVGEIEREQLIAELKSIHMGDWDSAYNQLGILDGEDWSVTLRFSGGSEECFHGSNGYPFSFTQFCDIMGYEDFDEEDEY